MSALWLCPVFRNEGDRPHNLVGVCISRVVKSMFSKENPNQTKSSWLGLVLVLVALAVPSPLVGWFDGLPWDGSAEMLALIVVLPLIVL